MLKKRIIPCLDVANGRVVKGKQFQNICDAGNPVEIARIYALEEADEIIFLDITASHENRNIMRDIVENTASVCFMPLTVGGGIRNLNDIRAILLAGADKVSINTAALDNPSLINAAAKLFGTQCIVIAIDVKKSDDGKWYVYTHGGRKATQKIALDWAMEAVDRGAGEILLTSMDTDGMKSGYDIPLTQMISSHVSVPVIASGGAGNIEHIAQVLTEGGADAVVAASIFHFGNYSIFDVKNALKNYGIPIRMPSNIKI